MTRTRTRYICQRCGALHVRWAGKCDSCNGWNTLEENRDTGGIGAGPQSKMARTGHSVVLSGFSGKTEEEERISSGIAELDRVTGGGFVRGSALLVGGDPGIGKSTLLTQASAALSRRGYSVLYVSGEEAVAQIRLRARRLCVSSTAVLLMAETNVEDILATLEKKRDCNLVIIDSIQTLWSDQSESSPGTVTQVRLGVQAMIHFAKQTGTTVVLVGHVTKEGQIAGPRVVEHMVDAVLYFEGEAGGHYRILRTIKNRFGATNEIGIFEMSDNGLREVSNPSFLFLGERRESVPGSAVFAAMEGTRPLLIEIQALVAPASSGIPRRAVLGWDTNRLSMVLAVLEAHCGIRFANHDVYLNVAGGYRIKETAADLAAAVAIVSSIAGYSLSHDSVYFGEISLSGRIRPVSQAVQRIREAEKLGFGRAIVSCSDLKKVSSSLKIHHIEELAAIIAEIAADSQKQER